MKNEYQGEIHFDSITGLPKSKKGGSHGLGMQSAQAFSDKLGGAIDCFLEDGFFWIILFAKFWQAAAAGFPLHLPLQIIIFLRKNNT